MLISLIKKGAASDRVLKQTQLLGVLFFDVNWKKSENEVTPGA
jgi:hypothetical protein